MQSHAGTVNEGVEGPGPLRAFSPVLRAAYTPQANPNLFGSISSGNSAIVERKLAVVVACPNAHFIAAGDAAANLMLNCIGPCILT